MAVSDENRRSSEASRSTPVSIMLNVTRALAFVTLVSSSVTSFSLPYDAPAKTKVIVTGAAGKTGKLVFTKLENNPSFQPSGVVRSEKSAFLKTRSVPSVVLMSPTSALQHLQWGKIEVYRSIVLQRKRARAKL